MRLMLLLLCCACGGSLVAQQMHYPVKLDKKWGLIDANGTMVLQPIYDAIGEFRAYGYAVMQRQGGVGLLNQQAKEIVPPRYEDIKVLDSTLIAVMSLGEWMVVDLKGNIILPKGYSRVQVRDGRFLAYTKDGKWGVVDRRGQALIEPKYDDVSLEEGRFFLTRKGESLGLVSITGKEILPTSAREIKVFSDSLFFFRSGNLWGAVNDKGALLIPAKYDTYLKITPAYIQLLAKNKSYVYSVACASVITQGNHDAYYAFSKKYLLVKENRQLGLIDWCGNTVLPSLYAEIQPYDGERFRANFQGKWGIIQSGNQVLIPFEYDYISPLQGSVCIVKKGNLFGIANIKGEEVVAPIYPHIELEGGRAKAYKKKGRESDSLSLLNFDEEGRLVGNDVFNQHFSIKMAPKKNTAPPGDAENYYQLEKYEWFYAPEKDRWGLRSLADGSIQIEPTFHYVKVEQEIGFTLVGIEKSEKYGFEHTRFRFDMIYGLVKNDVGLLVTEVAFWDVRFEDFLQGYPVARCVFSNGKHGLVDRIGRIISRDFAYIGAFNDGLAKVSIAGRLSGSTNPEHGLGKLSHYLSSLKTPNYMLDYTEYDQLFQYKAALTCENCEWGYIDTSGQIVVKPQYSFVRDFESQVGMVACNGKWGMIDQKGRDLIPCRYDGIQFLEKTNKQIVKVYIQTPKYGLIDTLGQLTVRAVYDEIGEFAEGRLAVKRNGTWGFVDAEGLEVIPCRFREVSNFSEGMAAVRLGKHWGFIDKQGNVEIDFKYRKAGNFRERLAWVSTDKDIGYINPKEEFVITPKWDKAQDFFKGVARVSADGKWGLIDSKGRTIARPKYIDIGSFADNGTAVVAYGKSSVAYGIINLQGEKLTRQDFVQIQPFSEGLAVVKDRNGYGYINAAGTLVIPCKYAKASAFRQSLAAVTIDGGCGYINPAGEMAIASEFTRCQDFDDGKAVVYKGMRRAGLLDTLGKYIFEPSIDRLLKFQEGRGLVRDEQYRFYYITEQADLHNGYYERASEFKHGMAVVQMGGKWGIINQRGIEVIPPRYDRIDGFFNGYAKVRIEGFNGLTNLKGELIVHPDYEFISYAGDGLFRVEQGDMVGYFDIQGQWVWDLSK